MIGDGGAVGGGGVGERVKLLLLPGKGQGGVAVGIHAAVGVSHGVALGSQDIIYSVVSTVADGQVVGALVKNVGAVAVGVVGGQVALVHVDGESFGLAGRQNAGLAEAAEGDGSLLHAVGHVVVSVRALAVDLHSLLARVG